MNAVTKKGPNGKTYNFSGMKDTSAFTQEGYTIEESATNGHNLVTSFLAIRKGKRIYGHYDYQKARYIEESVC